MKAISETIKTPRGIFKMHTEFETLDEAKEHGWHLHFTENNIAILNRDNRVGAIVRNPWKL